MTQATMAQRYRGIVRWALWPIAAGVTYMLLAVGAGCRSNKKEPATRPASMRERQNQALADPFEYKVNPDDDISGGKLGEYKKDSMKKDIDHVLNP
jgi:hypothetical protein